MILLKTIQADPYHQHFFFADPQQTLDQRKTREQHLGGDMVAWLLGEGT